MTRKKQKPTKALPQRARLASETDGQYILKLVATLILGTVWLKFAHPLMIGGVVPLGGVPLGLILGLIAVEHFERLQQDRKILYAILFLVATATYFLPAGIMI